MPLGQGKYDELCTYVRKSSKAKSAIVIVFKGEHGDGFSAQATGDVVARLPAILREAAQEIEDSFKKGEA